MESTLLVLLLILSVGLIVPELFRKLRLPFITSLILVGAALGPNGVDIVQTNETVAFFSFLGLTFLMFMSGLETRVEHIKQSISKVFILATINGGVPALVGFAIARGFGYDMMASLMVAIIFISSSIAIIIPSLKEAKLFRKDDGQLIVSAVVLEDVMSLMLLGILLQSVDPITDLPLPIYFVVLILSVVALKVILPKLNKLIFTKGVFKHKEHEDQLRFVIVVLMAVLLYFSAIGVHPIVAAFLLGLVLSGTVSSKKIFTQLHTIGYGLFVPVFFFMIGTQIDLTVFAGTGNSLTFLFTILLVSVLTKFASGYVAGRLVNISKEHSAMFGVASSIQLTTSLAATQAAFSLGIIDTPLLTSMVVLSIVTTVFAPIVLRLLGHNAV
ncbi:cation:proton antiporter [Candidatus Uhrbacteria bacterium]|jgi:Kef-type K+ transport system membrane component KefB|nr:cation:proton antiporter [Candidatus Uhrbacteria bacterium]